MNGLKALHIANGAVLAADDIPLHYGDLGQEYDSALNHAVLLDRSHDGRIALMGQDALKLINRMSTNKTDTLKVGEGCGTVFLTPTARIIERVEVLNRTDNVLLLTQPPRLERMMNYLKSNIFFNDQVSLNNITPDTAAFALHGLLADTIVEGWQVGLSELPMYASKSLLLKNAAVILVKRLSLTGSNYMVICDTADALKVYNALLSLGQPHGLLPAGSLTYNILRIRAGLPSLPELTEEYIPLELGLWQDVSFNKGCYTGQEIIARMDSRERLARVMVKLELSELVNAPAPILLDGKAVGTLTSSVQAPDGTIYAIGIVKTLVTVGTKVQINECEVTVGALLGTQPDWVH